MTGRTSERGLGGSVGWGAGRTPVPARSKTRAKAGALPYGNYRKVLLLCVNVFVSLRSVVLFSWDFLGDFG